MHMTFALSKGTFKIRLIRYGIYDIAIIHVYTFIIYKIKKDKCNNSIQIDIYIYINGREYEKNFYHAMERNNIIKTN